MTKDVLIQDIFAAFPTNNPPKPTDIVVGSSGEAITTKRIFIDRLWTDVSRADIIYHNSALGFLSDSAFRYYLPAYMLLLLEDIYRADIVASSVVNQLTLPLEVDQLRLMNFLALSGNPYQSLDDFLLEELRNSTENVAFFIRRAAGFTPQQGRCINAFLISLNELYPDYYDEHEPLIASKRYWFKYTS